VQSEKKLITIMIGNPGVGKSTILNGLIGRTIFPSGISLGKGLTTVCHREQDQNGNVYIDTPGLSDIKLRKQAAIEIKDALQSNGIFKIFFVITLEEGRIRPDDKTTMSLVLDAANILSNQYSIIINKLQPEIIDLMEDEELKKEFLVMLHEGLPGTNFIYLNLYRQELSAKKKCFISVKS